MERYLKTNAEHIYRDRTSSALINTDREAFMSYKKEREKILRAEEVFKDVDNIKQEMSDIKSLLKEVLDKIK